MSSRVAATIDSVNEKYSEARLWEEKYLEEGIKPDLAGLLYELLEKMRMIKNNTKREIHSYSLPGIRFEIENGQIIKFPEHYGTDEVYSPVRYVKETVKNIHDASTLLNRIRQFEEEGFIIFVGPLKDCRYKGKITLDGMYIHDAHELYNQENLVNVKLLGL